MVVVVDYGDFDGHAVEVDHAVDHTGGLGCRNTWVRHQVLKGGDRGTLITLAPRPAVSV